MPNTTTESSLSMIIRPATEEDLPFIYSSFVQSMNNLRVFASVNKFYMAAAHHSIMTRILHAGECLVAAHPTLPQVYGYIIFSRGEEKCLHYLYVKFPYRNEHVGTQLMTEAFGGFQDPINVTILVPQVRFYEEKWNLKPRPDLIGKVGRSE